jgi:heptosyltransferase-2
MATPFLNVLRGGYADAFITVLCRDYTAPLLERCPFIDRLVVYEMGKGVWAAVGALRRERPDSGWDTAFVLPTSFSSAAIALLSGSPRRVGFGGGVRGILLTDRIVGGGRRTIHLSRTYIGLLSYGVACDSENVPLPSVIPPYDWKDRVELFGIGGRYAVLAAGATYGPAKVWPERRYAEVARMISDRWGLRIVTVGSAGERSGLDSIIQKAGVSGKNMAGECEISELTTLLRGASLVVGNDSGPVHISASMGIPTVAIFGSTSPTWTAPRGPRVKVLYASVECSPCFRRDCPDGSMRCMTEIRCDDVISSAEEIWREAAVEQKD